MVSNGGLTFSTVRDWDDAGGFPDQANPLEQPANKKLPAIKSLLS